MSMEGSKKTGNDHGKKKMLINLGGGAGGGIGAVVLLATAAVASAFIVRRSKGRSSGKNQHRRRQSPPPRLNDKLETDQEDGTRKGQQLVILDTSSMDQSSGSAEEIGSENNPSPNTKTENFPVDENPTIEINGRNQGCVVYDGEAREQNLWSINPKEQENERIRDRSVANIDGESQSLDEKSHFVPKNMMPEMKIESAIEEIARESDDFNETCIEEGRGGGEEADGDSRIKETNNDGNGYVYSDQEESEVTEIKIEEKNFDKESEEVHSMVNGEIVDDECDEAVEKTIKAKDAENGLDLSEEEIIMGDGEEGRASLSETKHGDHSTEIVSTIDKDEATEVPLVKEWNQPEEEILVHEKREEEQWTDDVNSVENDLKKHVHEENVSVDDDEEKSRTDHLTVGNIQLGDYDVHGVNIAMPMHEEELNVSAGDSVVEEEKGQDKCEGDTEENVGKELEEELSEPSVATSVDQIGDTSEREDKCGRVITIANPKGYCDDDDEVEETDGLSDDVEGESSAETGDSSLDEEIWPAESMQESSIQEQAKQLIDHEVEGKIQEDIKLKQGENRSQMIITDQNSCVKEEEYDSGKRSKGFSTMDDNADRLIDGKGKDLRKNFVDKYMISPVVVDAHRKTSARRMMMIGFLSVLSSLSCSWFFGLSFVKICLLMLCTMALSQVHSN